LFTTQLFCRLNCVGIISLIYLLDTDRQVIDYFTNVFFVSNALINSKYDLTMGSIIAHKPKSTEQKPICGKTYIGTYFFYAKKRFELRTQRKEL
jgi:hypothetical protein